MVCGARGQGTDQLRRQYGPCACTADAANRQASDAEIIEIKRQVERGLSRGAPAVGLGIQYTPAASRTEILEIFRIAARFGAFVDVHVRYSGLQEPTSGIAGLREVLADAAATGAALHVDRITRPVLRSSPALLWLLSEGRSRGMDVTTECYSYTAGATGIESAYFSEGWR